VTAYKAGDDYASALTDASGNVVLGFRPDNIGTVTLTVTAFNCIPVQTSITLTASPNPLLVEGALTIDDDSSGGTSGNADGLPDAGETIDLTLPIKNNGAISASGVTGVLSTTTPGVTVIAPGVSLWSDRRGIDARPEPHASVSPLST
jgi:hypothetical protein